jgi:DNA (cytosine-5)-methyltransferase 1
MINVGSDFSGVGAFNQALDSLNIVYKTVFACDWDKYARQTYIHNYGDPDYYPSDVYDRKIPKESLDIYMTSPPCQAFSLAGKRKGEKDKRGVLFYNSHEFIVKNKPRYFIFENVKGLLSDDSGKTFNLWLDYLGGKSVNGNPVIFPLEDATPYHIYHKVLNAKNYGVPQNRERVFIIGIRDDSDNTFTFPKAIPLVKRLKDVLENDVDEKYYLSDLAIERLCYNDSGFSSKPKDDNDIANTVCASDYKIARGMNVLKVKSATKKSYEVATERDIINLSNLNSETRRGRVGKEVAQTLDTACNQAVMIAHVSRSEEGKRLRKESMVNGKDFTPFQAKQISFKESDVMNCITTATTKDNLIKIGAIRGRGNENNQRLELNLNGTSNSLTTVQKDNVVVCEQRNDEGLRFFKDGICGTIRTIADGGDKRVIRNQTIRRLTPRECFRLMDFPDTFTWPVSNSQAYKQAGNSIVVAVLAGVISKLNL